MAHALREKAAISGVGETAYTRGTPKSALALQLEASLAAIADAGLSPRDIDGVVPYFPGGGIAEDFVANLGCPISRSRCSCRWAAPPASRPSRPRAMAVATRRGKAVLISVGRTGYSGARGLDAPAAVPSIALAAEFEAPIGMFAPARSMAPGRASPHELYGTTARLSRRSPW